MKQTCSLNDIINLNVSVEKPFLIFLYGDLGAGKTTISSMIIQKNTNISSIINSPTYVYYNKYEDVYHFDLYRLENYDEFVSIGGEEILDNNEGIVLIEWPELLEGLYEPDLKIIIHKTDNESIRELELIYKKEA